MKPLNLSFPLIPLSVLALYLLFAITQSVGLIPDVQTITSSIQAAYSAHPNTVLVLAAFFATLVYVSLYSPTPFIIAIVIFVSEGTIQSFFSIGVVVTTGALIACLIGYSIGYVQNIQHKQKMDHLKSFILGHLSLYSLGSYYYRLGQHRTPLPLYLLGTTIVLPIYSIVICWIVYQFSGISTDNIVNYTIVGIAIWVLIELYRKNKVSFKIKH